MLLMWQKSPRSGKRTRVQGGDLKPPARCPSKLRVNRRYQIYVCVHLYFGVFGAGGGAERAVVAWRSRCVGVAEREGAAVGRRGGECGGSARGCAAWDDEGAGGGILRRGSAASVGGAGENDACCANGCGLEHLAARGGYGGGHDCARFGRTFFTAWKR